MLDSAGKRVAEQGQFQFLAERRERLDIPDGCRPVLKVCRYGPVRRTGTSVKVAAAYLYFHALASKPLLHGSAVQTKSSASTVAEATHTTL